MDDNCAALVAVRYVEEMVNGKQIPLDLGEGRPADPAVAAGNDIARDLRAHGAEPQRDLGEGAQAGHRPQGISLEEFNRRLLNAGLKPMTMEELLRESVGRASK